MAEYIKMPEVQKKIRDGVQKAFDNVIDDKFNTANKQLGTMQKQVEAFLHAFSGIDGKNNKLGDEGDDWQASAEAILADIQTTINFN